MDRKTVMIFGVSSFVGSNLAEYFKSKNYRVIGTYYENKVTIDGVLTLPCDILSKNQIQTILYTFRPELTIYAVGLSSLMNCREQPKLADALNTAGAFNVSGFSERYGSKFCYISSCYIFTGDEEEYRENDTPQPSTIYGKTQASSEFFVQKSCLNYLIFRTCALYGRNYNTNQLNFFELLERKAAKNETLECDSKIYLGFLDIHYLGMAIDTAFKLGVKNRLFQISSKDICTYYDFAKKYADVFEQSSGIASKGDWEFPLEINLFDANKESDSFRFKMNTLNLEGALNLRLPTIEESLNFTKQRLGISGRKKKMLKTSGVSFI